jgi:protein SCO1
MRRRSPSRRRAPSGTGAALRTAILPVLLLAACEAPWHGTPQEQPAPAPPLSLADASGAPFSLAEAKGEVVVLFFGYTHCPDVCPTVLADWARAKRALGRDAAGVRFVFVSVDPERDTPATARTYATQFDSAFVGLAGTPEATARILRDWGLAAYPEQDPRSGSYTVAHPAATFVVDRRGRLRLTFPPGLGSDALASDLRKLL